MTRSVVRVGAASLALTISVLGMAPAFAAPLSTADATAVSGSLAGNPTDSGVVTAVDDGSGEQRTGAASPPVGVLGNQRLLNVGVLAQEATARVTDGAGSSAACAGIAGNGGSVAQVGSSRCLTPGAPVGLSIANLDLTGSVLVDPESALEPLSELQPVMDQVVGPVTHAVSTGLAPLGETGLGGSLGAVEARCTATPGAADGTASIVDGRLTLSMAGTQVDVVNLPAAPPPNTELLVDLDTVATTVLAGVRENLNTALDGNLAPLNAASDPVQQEIVDGVLAQVAPQLAPLSDNVLRVVLNKQTRRAGSIQVTALSLEALPAADEAAGFPLGAVEIGRVSCGPNGEAVEAATPARVQKPRPRPQLPKMPTVVASGVAGDEQAWYDDLIAPVGLVVLATTVGLLGYRRATAP
jgi:hypothetical protein